MMEHYDNVKLMAERIEYDYNLYHEGVLLAQELLMRTLGNVEELQGSLGSILNYIREEVSK